MSTRPLPRRVVIVQRSLRQYRVPFYEQLRAELARRSVRLDVIHSNVHRVEDRGDPGHLEWATFVPRRSVYVGGREVLWQPVLGRVRSADLVIVEQASRLLVNYVLLGAQRFGGPKVAFWGHGQNTERSPNPVAEWVKRHVSKAPHWWFAYNERSAATVAGLGYPEERITVVQNTSDTTALSNDTTKVTPDDVAALRRELDLTGSDLGLFLGALSTSKHLDYLFAAADHVRARRPGFELVLAGYGEQQGLVEAEVARRPWARFAGKRFGFDKAVLLAAADVVLVPAWVGVVLTDCFAAGRPLVASATHHHPPEIAYLRDGVNGLLVDDHGDPRRYGDAVVDLLDDDDRRLALGQAGLQEAARHRTEVMVEHFAHGVELALEGA